MSFSKMLPAKFSRYTTAFQIMSDLHLEVGQQYATFHVSSCAPYLILAGDIGRLADYASYLDFLCSQCDKFFQVYLILGNHEFFGISRQEGLRLAGKLQHEPRLKGKLQVMNRERVDLEGRAPVTILGCTLQSHVPPDAEEIVGQKINDFRRIVDWKVSDHVAEHAVDVGWLEKEIKAIRSNEGPLKRQILVITHHAPSTRDTSKPTDENNPWSSAFGTDLLGMKEGSCLDDVQWWVFGHTHYSTEFLRGKVKLVSNQRGYLFPTKEEQKTTNGGTFKSSVRKLWGSNRHVQNTFDINKTIQV